MRRFPIALVIFLFAAVIAIFAFVMYFPGAMVRWNHVSKIKEARSEIYTRMLVHYDKPPVYEEEYRMQDVDGVSTYEYRIRGYNGRQVTIAAPDRRVYDVSFFYGRLNQEGIWELVNQAPRGDTDVHYTIFVKQVVDNRQGDRTIVFTDPRYLATQAGRQYHIDLSKNKPGDLLKMQSTVLADPRYQTIVNEFRTFGPDRFRRAVAAARARVIAGK